MRLAKIGVITLFLLMAIGGIGGVMLQVTVLFCVPGERARQPFKQAIDNDRRQRHQHRPLDNISRIKPAKPDNNRRA
ncbi:membrane protein [Salmonella enterica subsp. arizonae]|uniref:Membrane protein n=1 Tax=Salmonella enterica subsp. arizonae TaxID=59203 RepID=A0A379SU26_SALER|nr:membrane protein [Salmonella enterica subsp. arizonae]